MPGALKHTTMEKMHPKLNRQAATSHNQSTYQFIEVSVMDWSGYISPYSRFETCN